MTADVPVKASAHQGPRAGEPLLLRLTAIRYATPDIHLFEFCDPAGHALPAFTAGAHIDVHLPNGWARPYSLCNDPQETHRYVTGIKRDAAGRGGSRLIHDQFKVGQLVPVSLPRNHFALHEGAPHSVLIAGGIGITPVACMVHRLRHLGASFEVHYSVKQRHEAALLDALTGPELHLHVDVEHGGQPMNLAALLTGAPPQAHLYCCGPAPMLDAFEAATKELPADHVHLERFGAAPLAPIDSGFTVQLARSGRQVLVGKGSTILEVLRKEGIALQASCEQGICGSCETRVLSGRPDHRDSLLSEQEKQANQVMMVCCSGSLDPVLVLDL